MNVSYKFDTRVENARQLSNFRATLFAQLFINVVTHLLFISLRYLKIIMNTNGGVKTRNCVTKCGDQLVSQQYLLCYALHHISTVCKKTRDYNVSFYSQGYSVLESLRAQGDGRNGHFFAQEARS